MREFTTFVIDSSTIAMSWNPDGDLLAVSNGDDVFICNLDDECTSVNEEPIPIVSSISWHPDDTLLATSGNRLNVWDVSTGDNLEILDWPENEAVGGIVEWSNDGNLLAFTTTILSGGAQLSSLFLWNRDKGNITEIPYESIQRVYSLAFSPDDSQLAILNSSQLVLWNFDTEELVIHTDGHDSLLDLAYHPSENTLAYAVWIPEKAVHTIFIYTEFGSPGESTFRFPSSLDTTITSLVWNPSSDEVLVTGEVDGTVRLWDASRGETISVLVDNEQDFSTAIASMSWSADGNYLAIARRDGVVIIFEQAADDNPHSVEDPVEPCYTMETRAR